MSPAVQVILAHPSGDSVHRLAQRIQCPFETFRQAVKSLEKAGYIQYEDVLTVADNRVREAARQFVVASAREHPPSIEEAYVLPQFADAPYAFS